uniref:2-oxoglutarate dehydrogenase E1 subunit family protein n=1 Tax=Kineosporia sp. A_224 TaxID=1962180 RepID=UPI001E4FEAF2
MTQHASPEHASSFGPNEWLVDELYQQYLADKNSVDPAWWEFFADYQPSDLPHGKPGTIEGGSGVPTSGNGTTATMTTGAPAAQQAAPTSPAPAAPPAGAPV